MTVGEREVLVSATDAYPRNMGADIIGLDDGAMLLVFSQWIGAAHDNDSSRVCGLLSNDGGASWSSQFEIAGPTDDYDQVRMPGLIRLNDGTIGMTLRFRTSVLDTWVGFMRCDPSSLAVRGRNWTDPVRISPPPPGRHIHLNNRTIRLASGRLLVSLATSWPWNVENTRANDSRSWCLLSDDDGATWRPSKSNLAGPKRGLMEPYVIEVEPGQLRMFMRTQVNCQYESFSFDDGETWSEAKPGILVSPESPSALRHFPDSDDILVVWNHGEIKTHGKDRNPLNLAISSDGCESWHDEVTLENASGKAFSYPGVHVLKMGGRDFVFITYYEQSEGRISLIARKLEIASAA